MKIPQQFFDIGNNLKSEEMKTCDRVLASLAHNPQSSTQSFVIAFKDGVAYEPAHLWGISHFVEHILFRGTEDIPTLYDISRKVEGIGGKISAYSMRDMVAFFLKVPPGYEERAFYILEQLILHPSLNPPFIDQEKAIIHQERQREINNPNFLNSLMVENILLFPSPVSRHPVGDDNVIERISPDIIRDYMKNVYHGNNLHIAVAGNITDKIYDMTERFTAAFPKGSPVKKADFTLEGNYGDAKVFHLQSHHKNQVFLSVGWKFRIESEQELFDWKVLSSLLGAGYTGILNRVLREEENITYLCTAKFNYYDDTGIFKLSMSLGDNNLKRAMECIDKIMQDIADGHVDREIFNEAVIRHASSLLFRMEDSLEVAKIFAHNLVKENTTFSFKDYYHNLENVSFESVCSLAGRHLVSENRAVFLQTGSDAVDQCFKNVFKLQKIEGGKLTSL